MFILLFNTQLWGQSWSSNKNSFEKNWNISVQAGITALIKEINTDFSHSQSDMNKLPNWCLNLQVAKMVSNGLDVGVEFGFSNYSGYNDNPTDINMLVLHKSFNNNIQSFLPYSIYYESDLTNFALFGKYNFINFNSWDQGYTKLNSYVKFGFGIAFPSVEMGYNDFSNYEFTGLTHPLYLKGRYPDLNKESHSFMNLAIGLNYQLNHRIFLSIEPSAQLINTDNLDGILNYSTSLTPDIPINQTDEYRIKVYNITARFLLGLTYFFNFDTHRQMRQKHLPWYSMQFQSYYSKFHNKTTKNNRQEQSPFFNEKWDEKK